MCVALYIVRHKQLTQVVAASAMIWNTFLTICAGGGALRLRRGSIAHHPIKIRLCSLLILRMGIRSHLYTHTQRKKCQHFSVPLSFLLSLIKRAKTFCRPPHLKGFFFHKNAAVISRIYQSSSACICIFLEQLQIIIYTSSSCFDDGECVKIFSSLAVLCKYFDLCLSLLPLLFL